MYDEVIARFFDSGPLRSVKILGMLRYQDLKIKRDLGERDQLNEHEKLTSGHRGKLLDIVEQQDK